MSFVSYSALCDCVTFIVTRITFPENMISKLFVGRADSSCEQPADVQHRHNGDLINLNECSLLLKWPMPLRNLATWFTSSHVFDNDWRTDGKNWYIFTYAYWNLWWKIDYENVVRNFIALTISYILLKLSSRYFEIPKENNNFPERKLIFHL